MNFLNKQSKSKETYHPVDESHVTAEHNKITKEHVFSLEQLIFYINRHEIKNSVFYAEPYRKFDGNGNSTTHNGDMVSVDEFGQIIPLISIISPTLKFKVKETVTRVTVFDQWEIVYVQDGYIKTLGLQGTLDNAFFGKYNQIDEIYYKPKKSEPKDWKLLYKNQKFFID